MILVTKVTPAERVGRTAARETFEKLADAVAALDLDQEDREKVAEAVVGALVESRIGRLVEHPEVYVLLASDPLVPCAGWDADGEQHDCPNETVIRQRFHLSSAPDQRAPYGEIRCVSCGAMQFLPEYRENVLARAER